MKEGFGKVICVRCGKATEKPEGSLRQPYCKKCWEITGEEQLNNKFWDKYDEEIKNLK